MKKVIFLDRDGTINVDHGYVYKIEDWEWQPGAIAGIKKLKAAGYNIAIITNQSAIGDGTYTIADMQKLHDFMTKEFEKEGVRPVAIAFCPHRRDGDCDCRKPKLGMAKQAEEQIGAIDYGQSWTVGDKIADMQFGKNAGTKTALLRSKYWKPEELSEQPDVIADSLEEAAKNIVTGNV
jgi:D-glycero-D-manno-heptose 1,7-bisphosphate phosphatase